MKRSRSKVFAALVLAAAVGLSAIGLAVAAPQGMAQTGPTIPAWIHPGLVVVYDGVSAFVRNGRFTQGVREVMTTRVTSVAGNQVSAITNMQTVGAPIGGNHAWICDAAGNCRSDATGLNNKFWVDIAHPADSVKGPNGEPYRVLGQAPYSYGGRTWTGVGMSYVNPATGVQLMLTYDARTGLILQYSETSPSEQVHIYFRTMSGQ